MADMSRDKTSFQRAVANRAVAILDPLALHESNETRFDMLASIRGNIRNLTPERRDEIFADFGDAVKSGNIGYLADTVANWAL